MSEVSRTQPLPMRPPSGERLLVVGDGAVARAITKALERAGVGPQRWWRSRGQALPPSDVVLLAVRDEAIGEVAQLLMARLLPDETPPILLHCSGALPAREAFAAVSPRPLGVGVIFGIEGDGPGCEAALRIVKRLGGSPLLLDAAQLPAYHAAAALVSNHAVALVDAGVSLLTSVGLDQTQATAGLTALLASTTRNLGLVGLPDALTGPISRGDVAVVARHLLALRPYADIAALYRATARRVLKVAADKGRATRDALKRIAALLVDGD